MPQDSLMRMDVCCDVCMWTHLACSSHVSRIRIEPVLSVDSDGLSSNGSDMNIRGGWLRTNLYNQQLRDEIRLCTAIE